MIFPYDFHWRVLSLFTFGFPIYAEPWNFRIARSKSDTWSRTGLNCEFYTFSQACEVTGLNPDQMVSAIEAKLRFPGSPLPMPFVEREVRSWDHGVSLYTESPFSPFPTAKYNFFFRSEDTMRIRFIKKEIDELVVTWDASERLPGVLWPEEYVIQANRNIDQTVKAWIGLGVFIIFVLAGIMTWA